MQGACARADAYVRTHLATIYRKLEVSSKLDLHARLDGAPPQADIKIGHGDRIEFGSMFLEVRATPGHTDGCLSYVCDDMTHFTRRSCMYGRIRAIVTPA